MIKKILAFLSVPALFLAFPVSVSAHCPLCVAGAAAGLTLSRILGIDDSITGVWMAAFLGAMSFWTVNIIAAKVKFKISFLREIIYVLIFVLTIASFYQFKLVIRMGDIFGFDKLTFGMVTGGILFYLVDRVDDYLITKNGKVFFPYQRIAVSLGSMIVWSLAIFILINYFI